MKELQKTFITDGQFLSNLYQKWKWIQIHRLPWWCELYERQHPGLHGLTFYEMLYCHLEMACLFWGRTVSGPTGDIIFIPPVSHRPLYLDQHTQNPIPAMWYGSTQEFIEEYPAVLGFIHYRISSVRNPGQQVGVHGKIFSICLQRRLKSDRKDMKPVFLP